MNTTVDSEAPVTTMDTVHNENWLKDGEIPSKYTRTKKKHHEKITQKQTRAQKKHTVFSTPRKKLLSHPKRE